MRQVLLRQRNAKLKRWISPHGKRVEGDVLCYVGPVLPSRRTRLCMDPTHSPTLSLRSCCCCSLFFSITPSFNLINQTARLVPRRRFLQSSQQHSDGGAVAVGGKKSESKGGSR